MPCLALALALALAFAFCVHSTLRIPLVIACRQGVPTDDLIGFIFEGLLDQRAVKQIKECASVLRGILDAAADKRRTQRAVLQGVTNLVTAPKHGDGMLKKTPTILMALYALC